MRTLAITQNVTLDGSVELPEDWFDPQARGLGDMDDLQQEVQRQSAASDAFLTGRHTFEDLPARRRPDRAGPVAKEMSGSDIVLTGSITLAHTLIEAWSTRCRCSPIRWCRVAGAGCSRTGSGSNGCGCSTHGRSPRGSC